jgi:hypothetical protein
MRLHKRQVDFAVEFWSDMLYASDYTSDKRAINCECPQEVPAYKSPTKTELKPFKDELRSLLDAYVTRRNFIILSVENGVADMILASASAVMRDKGGRSFPSTIFDKNVEMIFTRVGAVYVKRGLRGEWIEVLKGIKHAGT